MLHFNPAISPFFKLTEILPDALRAQADRYRDFFLKKKMLPSRSLPALARNCPGTAWPFSPPALPPIFLPLLSPLFPCFFPVK